MSAVTEGPEARTIIQMLLDAGANPDAKGSNANSAHEMEKWALVMGDAK